MQRSQVQQFALGLQFSIQPVLTNKNQQMINAQLNHLRFASVLPVTAIALYNADGRTVGETDAAKVLHQFKVSQPVQSFQLHQLGQSILAVQPVSTSVLDAGNDNALSSASTNEHYILVLIEPDTNYSVWLLPLLITAIIGFTALLVIQGAFQRGSQQLQTDVSLIAHKLSQLKQGQLNSRLNDDLVAELMPVKQALNELSAQLALTGQRETEVNKQFQLQLQQADTKQQQAIYQADLTQQHLQQHIKWQRIQHQLLEQLLSQTSEMAASTLNRALSNYTAITKLQLNQNPDGQELLLLSDVIAEQLPGIYDVLADNQIRLDLVEAADNAKLQVMLAKPQLLLLLDALIQTGAQFSAVSELTLTVELQAATTEHHLFIKLSGNGEGMSDLTLQYLTSDVEPRYWQQMPVQLLKLAAHKLDALLDVQSLHGLGSTIAITIPIKDIHVAATVLPASLLVFDQQASRLAERKSVLAELVKNLVLCRELTELESKVRQGQFDTVLIFLPQPEQLSVWLDLITLLRGTRLICQAEPANVAVWREALGVEVFTSCFCLARLYAGAVTQRYIKLLVVDDNQTNLAFIQILLKEQPVELVTASCGEEAVTLCTQQQFELILLDIQLPDLHGTEVSALIRKLAGYQQVPILAFTAHALTGEVDSFIAAGMNDVIFKPLDATKLQQILRWCSLVK